MAGVKSWSRTAGNNVLANTGFTFDEGQSPSSLNDSARQLMADVATEWSKATDIASASAPDITGTATTSGGFIHITGTTTITSFATATAGIRRRLVFDGALTLTHNATSLILPGGANITTAANDCAEMVSEGSGNWRCISYVPATGKAVKPMKVKVGVTTHDISVTGTQDVTGIGFTPTAVLLLGAVNGSSYMSIYVTDATTHGSVSDNYAVTAGQWIASTSLGLYFIVGAGTYAYATVTALASGQFTLTWTKNGSPTGTAGIYYMAFGY